MVATDAAGEGINLQFCHIMINYDLPWNPTRIDQRIGRLHRYGQKRDVKVQNLFVTDTREGQILARLMQKVAIIEKHLGGKISEIVGFVLEGVNLQDLIMRAVADNRPVEATAQDIERAIDDRRKAFDTIEKTFLMDLKRFDLEETLKVIEKSKERSTTEEEIERFTRSFFDFSGGKFESTRKKLVYRLIPPKEVLREGLREKYEAVTFSKEVAKDLGEEVQFIAFGHPLLESVIDYCRDRSYRFGGRATIRYSDKYDKDGILFNFLLTFEDATGKIINEDILPVLITLGGEVTSPSPRLIPEFSKEIQNRLPEDLNKFLLKADNMYNKAYELSLQKAKDFCSFVQMKKSREIKIKKEDAEKFFNTRIKEEEERLKDYKFRQSLGEDMGIAIRGSERRIEDLKDELKKNLNRLEEEELVIEKNPELLSIAIIIAKNKI
jgi:hypothetical protein